MFPALLSILFAITCFCSPKLPCLTLLESEFVLGYSYAADTSTPQSL